MKLRSKILHIGILALISVSTGKLLADPPPGVYSLEGPCLDEKLEQSETRRFFEAGIGPMETLFLVTVVEEGALDCSYYTSTMTKSEFEAFQKKNPDAKIADLSETSLLQLAVVDRDWEILELLISKVDPDQKSQVINKTLHRLVAVGHNKPLNQEGIDLLKSLVARGADYLNLRGGPGKEQNILHLTQDTTYFPWLLTLPGIESLMNQATAEVYIEMYKQPFKGTVRLTPWGLAYAHGASKVAELLEKQGGKFIDPENLAIINECLELKRKPREPRPFGVGYRPECTMLRYTSLAFD